MKTRPTTANSALLLACIATLTACESEKAPVTSSVNLYTVVREDLPINVKEGGELVAVKEQVVKSQIEGNATILSLAPEGTLVKKGDKLVELDVSSLVEKRATQEISVEQARNSMEQAKTAGNILEKELITKQNTAESQRQIAEMELEKLLGAVDGKGSEGRNADMVDRLRELVNPPPPKSTPEEAATGPTEPSKQLIAHVRPQNYKGLVDTVIALLKVKGEVGDPLQRGMGEMANKVLQQADTIRLAMADLKVKEDTVAHSRSLAEKQFITRNELERDELAYQSQASKVTIAWNDLELLINYTLRSSKIELKQNLANAELEVERVQASNEAERSNSAFDVGAKQKEWEVAAERLANLEKQVKNSVIFSPGSGLVVYSKVSRGRGDSEPVEEGTSVRERQSIIILPDNSELMCEVKVQEAMIDKVRVGLPAHISAEVRPNEVLTGRVVYVAPVADSASRYSGNDKKVYTTKILLDGVNEDESLKAGMKASASIAVDNIEDVLTAPIQAVRRDRSVNYVWKHTDKGPLAVRVEVGHNNQEKVEVTAGLSAGDVIYRTPPSGKDPKFDQPALPEVAPPTPGFENPSKVKTPDGPGNRMGNGDRRQGGRRPSKKFADMSAEELKEGRSKLLDRLDRMSGFLKGDNLTKYTKSVNDIVKAIDAKELAEADRLQALMNAATRKAMGNRGGRGGRDGGGRNGGGRDGGGRRRNNGGE